MNETKTAAQQVGECIGSWLNFAAKCAVFCIVAKKILGNKHR